MLSQISDPGSLSSESVEVFELGDLKETVLNKMSSMKSHNTTITNILNGKGTETLMPNGLEPPVSKLNNIKQEFLEYENKAKENFKNQQTVP